MENINENTEENDLNLPFEKLNVSYYQKKRKDVQYSPQQQKQNQSMKCRWTIMEKAKSSLHDDIKIKEDDVYQKIYFTKRKRKEKPKSIIREAKLKLPIQLTDKTRKFKSRKGKPYNDDNNEPNVSSIPKRNPQQHFNQHSMTCSSQYILNLNDQVPVDIDNNSSYDDDELALYFEQMLYIPKPMSLMAEMMYA